MESVILSWVCRAAAAERQASQQVCHLSDACMPLNSAGFTVYMQNRDRNPSEWRNIVAGMDPAVISNRAKDEMANKMIFMALERDLAKNPDLGRG